MTYKQPRIRAKITNDWVDYPHNDLSNAAWFFRERIKILEPKPATLAEITDFLDKAYACYHKLIQSRRDYLVWLVASDARPAWFDDVMD
jgi:hypothetical protein